MLTKKNSTYMPQMASPVMRAGTNGALQAHYLYLLQWLTGWLTGGRKKESQPSMEVNYELENDRFTENGYFHISEEQARLERMIELNWVNLRMKRNL
jgi:hypothetical protein